MTENSDNELFAPIFYSYKGCFHYYRDHRIGLTPRFVDFITHTIKLAVNHNKNPKRKLYAITNTDLEDVKTVKVHITDVTDDLSAINGIVDSSDFRNGITIFLVTNGEYLDGHEAGIAWLRVVQCNLENESVGTVAFGEFETFSLLGDSNILVWTNPCIEFERVQIEALDLDRAIQHEDFCQPYISGNLS